MSQHMFDPVWAPPQPYLSYVELTKDQENKKRCNLAQVQGNSLLVSGRTRTEYFLSSNCST